MAGTASVVGMSAVNSITTEDCEHWLAEHGLVIDGIAEAAIRLERDQGTATILAWLDVTWYKRNTDGAYYLDETGSQAATGSSSIPLKSFPSLTPAG